MRNVIAFLVLLGLIILGVQSLVQEFGIWDDNWTSIFEGYAFTTGGVLLALTALGGLLYWIDRRKPND